MAYKHVRFDLRTKYYRRRKDYWRGRREDRIPWPKYKKPVLTAIKLDPGQAILVQCIVNGEAWFWGGGTKCIVGPSDPAQGLCNVSVRGVHPNWGWGAQIRDTVPS